MDRFTTPRCDRNARTVTTGPTSPFDS